jgi:tetratricopeptide (TPR) repeat protein
MSSTIYNSAVSLNNQGVVHFERGNYEKARTFFREALEAIKLSMNGVQQALYLRGSKPSVGFQWSKNGPLHAELNLPVPAGTSFIFRRALVIVPVSGVVGVNAELQEESTAIIYNLALSYVISGFIGNCSDLLEKARKFFEIVLAMRQRRNEATKLDGERLLDTAICNNLGWLNEEFCDYKAAQECYHQVSARLIFLSRSGFLDKNDCEGFIANLVLDAHPSMAAAA